MKYTRILRFFNYTLASDYNVPYNWQTIIKFSALVGLTIFDNFFVNIFTSYHMTNVEKKNVGVFGH